MPLDMLVSSLFAMVFNDLFGFLKCYKSFYCKASLSSECPRMGPTCWWARTSHSSQILHQQSQSTKCAKALNFFEKKCALVDAYTIFWMRAWISSKFSHLNEEILQLCGNSSVTWLLSHVKQKTCQWAPNKFEAHGNLTISMKESWFQSCS